MPVVRLMQPRPETSLERVAPTWPAVREVCIARDGPAVAALVTAFAASPGQGAGPVPDAPGLLGELRNRPGRQTESWLAVPESTRCDGPLGLVLLIQSRRPGGTTIRYSLGWLLVHPAARRQGVGRTLVAHACRRAWTLGAGDVWVESRTDWAAAIAFWEAVGFRQAPVRRPGADAGG